MNTLIAVGTLSAYIYSSIATFFPSLFIRSGLTPQVYFDGAAMIIALILLGRLLEARAEGQTSEAIRKLMVLAPKARRCEIMRSRIFPLRRFKKEISFWSVRRKRSRWTV